MVHLWCRAPQGFALERVARVPYLCKGDQYKNYYGTRVLAHCVLVAVATGTRM